MLFISRAIAIVVDTFVTYNNVKIGHTSGAMLRFESNYFGFRGGNMTSEYKNFNISNVIGEKSDNYAIFIDGYGDKPINGINIKGFTVKNAAYPYYKKCATNIVLNDVTVNGKPLPSTLEESEQRKTLDIY